MTIEDDIEILLGDDNEDEIERLKRRVARLERKVFRAKGERRLRRRGRVAPIRKVKTQSPRPGSASSKRDHKNLRDEWDRAMARAKARGTEHHEVA